MADMNNLNLITTECGKQYIIDFLDQVALGILDSEEYKHNSLFIPPTYSLYKTITEEYILEITHFHAKSNSLKTRYRVLSNEDAGSYLENGSLNLLQY
ncbi:MAG: hypothetical protein COW65_10465 [Cytophagales bacterium CG18_big_fil_WC_8_21_14_2_50_42_9]|nr:MAG: hypothetical protein COW65_10465 [Cytophagales bacterium CG18_big_fil_WC_8_21_14_2_50_42_9]